MTGKSIKAMTNKRNKYEKHNFKYPEFSISICFRWVLHAKCGYKFDAHVAKAAKTIEDHGVNIYVTWYRLYINSFLVEKM